MKKLPLIILLFAAAACSSPNDTPGVSVSPKAKTDSIAVSTKGIGDLKIGMKKETVEKLLKHKVATPNLSVDSPAIYRDTVTCTYKGEDYTLVFAKQWQEADTDSANIIKLSQVSSRSLLLKTPSGIGIGDDLCKIVSTYKDDRLNISPVYDYTKEPWVRIKGKSEVWLTLSELELDKRMVFYMTDNKIEGMSVAFFESE